jgi:hypothetical protein
MQYHILDVTARARSAGHLADWQREGDIIIGWIEQLKVQGQVTAPGALGAYLWVHWMAECKRQQTLNRPAAKTAGTNPVRQWFPPDSNSTASRPRSRKGPIGLIIDLHSKWHDEVLRASNLITSVGASIIIPSGPHQQHTSGEATELQLHHHQARSSAGSASGKHSVSTFQLGHTQRYRAQGRAARTVCAQQGRLLLCLQGYMTSSEHT